MLKSTFCHLPGIGIRRERNLWSVGITNWEELLEAKWQGRRPGGPQNIASMIEESVENLRANNPRYFAERLPSNQHWRLFTRFRDSIAYLDIETTGLDYGDIITTIALYDGKSIFHFVNGDNLKEFKARIRDYKLIVTYNGKSFDVPFIERYLRVTLDQVHIDLRYMLRSLRITGGQKGCEKRLGIGRKGLEDIDGFFAVLLWQDFKKNNNPKALETLLAYNIQDAVNLETLLAMAYNLKVADLPFGKSHVVPLPCRAGNPFAAHGDTVERIRRKYYWY